MSSFSSISSSTNTETVRPAVPQLFPPKRFEITAVGRVGTWVRVGSRTPKCRHQKPCGMVHFQLPTTAVDLRLSRLTLLPMAQCFFGGPLCRSVSTASQQPTGTEYRNTCEGMHAVAWIKCSTYSKAFTGLFSFSLPYLWFLLHHHPSHCDDRFVSHMRVSQCPTYR